MALGKRRIFKPSKKNPSYKKRKIEELKKQGIVFFER
jgi:hypothetical protein